jgi:hypothetical protein
MKMSRGTLAPGLILGLKYLLNKGANSLVPMIPNNSAICPTPWRCWTYEDDLTEEEIAIVGDE